MTHDIHMSELEHYGVPGMRWGVHRARRGSGTSSTKLPHVSKRAQAYADQRKKEYENVIARQRMYYKEQQKRPFKKGTTEKVKEWSLKVEELEQRNVELSTDQRYLNRWSKSDLAKKKSDLVSKHGEEKGNTLYRRQYTKEGIEEQMHDNRVAINNLDKQYKQRIYDPEWLKKYGLEDVKPKVSAQHSFEDQYNEFLEHYGVIGMRWGVHRARSSSSSGQNRRSSKPQTKEQKAKDIKKKRIKDYKTRSTLSNKQLDAKINRLKKEKQLRELMDSEVSPGRAAVKQVLKKAGTQTATTVLTKYGVKAASYGIDSLTKYAAEQLAKKAAS